MAILWIFLSVVLLELDFANEFAVVIDGGEDIARRVAIETNHIYNGKVRVIFYSRFLFPIRFRNIILSANACRANHICTCNAIFNP